MQGQTGVGMERAREARVGALRGLRAKGRDEVLVGPEGLGDDWVWE